MSEAELAAKKVESAILDNWSRGQSLADLLTQKDATKGGDSLDVGEDTTGGNAGPTIVRSEFADPEAKNMSRHQLIVNNPVFVNRNLSPTQMAQLLNGSYATEMVRSNIGHFRNAIDDIVVDKLMYGMSASAHANLATAAGTKSMLTRIEAKMLSIPGIREEDLLWILSPAAGATVGDLFNDVQPALISDSADLGKIKGRSINGTPAVRNAGIPGYLRRRKAIVSSAITGGDTLTLVMEDADHDFVVGQHVRTTGLDQDAGDSSISTDDCVVATVSGTTITIVDTGFTDTANNGEGFLETDSAMALLIARSRCFYGSDQVIPQSSITKRTDAAGWVHQLFQHIGVLALSGAVRTVHFDLVEAED